MDHYHPMTQSSHFQNDYRWRNQKEPLGIILIPPVLLLNELDSYWEKLLGNSKSDSLLRLWQASPLERHVLEVMGGLSNTAL